MIGYHDGVAYSSNAFSLGVLLSSYDSGSDMTAVYNASSLKYIFNASGNITFDDSDLLDNGTILSGMA